MLFNQPFYVDRINQVNYLSEYRLCDKFFICIFTYIALFVVAKTNLQHGCETSGE